MVGGVTFLANGQLRRVGCRVDRKGLARHSLWLVDEEFDLNFAGARTHTPCHDVVLVFLQWLGSPHHGIVVVPATEGDPIA